MASVKKNKKKMKVAPSAVNTEKNATTARHVAGCRHPASERVSMLMKTSRCILSRQNNFESRREEVSFDRPRAVVVLMRDMIALRG